MQTEATYTRSSRVCCVVSDFHAVRRSFPGVMEGLDEMPHCPRADFAAYYPAGAGEKPPPGAGKEETEMEKRMGEMEWRHTRAMTVLKNHC